MEDITRLVIELANTKETGRGDLLGLVDELLAKLMPPRNLRVVIGHWSPEMGKCYDCGMPAAYAVVGINPTERNAYTLRCAVCAAQEAWQGEKLDWLYAEDEEAYLPVLPPLDRNNDPTLHLNVHHVNEVDHQYVKDGHRIHDFLHTGECSHTHAPIDCVTGG